MNQSEQINELASSLAKAQGSFPEIPRNRSVKVSLKAGGSYNFKYATLDAILEAIRKPLTDNGLALCCYLNSDEKGEICTTRLLHQSGQWIECAFPVIVDSGANAQGWGSALTYAKRNAISALLAIHADEDDDGAASCGHDSEPQKYQSRPQTQQKPVSKPPVAPKAPQPKPTTTANLPPSEKPWTQCNESEKIARTESRIEAERGNSINLQEIFDKLMAPGVLNGVSENNVNYLVAKAENALEEAKALQAQP